jgi:hypothetical protein
VGLFSASPQLRETSTSWLSLYFFSADVDGKLRGKGKIQVAKSQDALLKTLVPDEKLLLIVLCFWHY